MRRRTLLTSVANGTAAAVVGTASAGCVQIDTSCGAGETWTGVSYDLESPTLTRPAPDRWRVAVEADFRFDYARSPDDGVTGATVRAYAKDGSLLDDASIGDVQ